VPDAQSVTIPDKPAFKAGEVCELAQIQPYVLRSWESEFPDLGLSKTPGGPRIYRRVDVERVLRIRDLVFVEGLTLSGVRRRFESEKPEPPDDLFAFVAEVQAAQARAKDTAAPPAAPAPAPVAAPAPAAPAPKPVKATITQAPLVAVEASAPAAPPPVAAVPDQTKAQIVRLKQDMRSLLDLLGGGGQAAPASPPAPAARRSRRS
jgi:DNA-binding transcriptional MerR regulator